MNHHIIEEIKDIKWLSESEIRESLQVSRHAKMSGEIIEQMKANNIHLSGYDKPTNTIYLTIEAGKSDDVIEYFNQTYPDLLTEVRHNRFTPRQIDVSFNKVSTFRYVYNTLQVASDYLTEQMLAKI
jgi:hypothetical protein